MAGVNREPAPVDLRKFLTSVLALDSISSSGYVTLHWIHKDTKRCYGRSYRNLDELIATAEDINQAGKYDIYFCLSTQRANGGKRSIDNAKALRAVWVDFDVDPDNDKKYPTAEAALRAL